MTLPTVNVFVLGGTITMVHGSDGGITPTLTGDDLLAQLPALQGVAQLVVHTPFLKPGASLTMNDIAQVVDVIGQDHEAAGSVVVQGTDTIDETSFLIQLLHTGDTPIVVTGAMRGASATSADGPANLSAAIHVAASESARGQGALVVLNDEIHHAVHVEKMHKGLTSAFQSPNGGPLGYFLENAVRFVRRAALRTQPPLAPQRFGKVALVKATMDDDGALFSAVPELGYEGVVVEAMGVGHVPMALLDSIQSLVDVMPVVLASRVPGGPVFHRTYGFAGSEIDLLARGLVPAGWLSPHKARLLLSVAIGAELGREAIRDAFSVFD